MYYVTDTHSFLWYLADSPRLSQKARAVFDAADAGRVAIIIPAIVLLEAIDILDKKKVALDFNDLVIKISQSQNFIFSEIDWSLILKVNQVKGLKDLHDRIIVATGQIFDAGIISKDEIIQDFYGKTVW